MHDDLRNHAKEKVLDKADSEAKAGPVMAEFHDLEAITIKVDFTVKVHLVEGLHWDLVLAMIFGLVFRFLESKVVLNTLARVLGLFIFARTDGGDDQPVSSQQRSTGEDGEEDGRLEATADLPCQPVRGNDHDGSEAEEREAVIARGIRWQGSILDSWVLLEGGKLVSVACPRRGRGKEQ